MLAVDFSSRLENDHCYEAGMPARAARSSVEIGQADAKKPTVIHSRGFQEARLNER